MYCQGFSTAEEAAVRIKEKLATAPGNPRHPVDLQYCNKPEWIPALQKAFPQHHVVIVDGWILVRHKDGCAPPELLDQTHYLPCGCERVKSNDD